MVAEEGGNAVFQITMSNTSPNTVTVDFATSDNTARAGSDYGGGRGTLTFTPGQLVKTVSVPIVRDSATEEIERFFMNLSNARNATISDNQGSAFIVARLYDLPKVNPRSFTASTKPRRDAKRPHTFTTRGRLGLPNGVNRSQGCRGRVSVQVKAGRKTISTRRTSVRRTCTYTSRVTFKNNKRFTKSGVLTVRARFLGNDVLRRKSARAHRVRGK